MQSLLPIINAGASVFVVLSQAFSLLVIILILTKKRYQVLDFISKYILIIVFLVSAGAVLVSLFYSDVIGYAPCLLCWLQRIFVYPVAFISALAIWKRDRSIIDYALLLSVIGFFIGVYHNLVYYFDISLVPCPATGPSCAAHYVSELGGYVSIPMMSMTAFLLLVVLLVSAKIRKND
jgi:disulfide bond formation protein DsbB